LLNRAGIDFSKLKTRGIEPKILAENLNNSGFLRNNDLNWVTFHGTSDFAYLLKLLTNRPLPPSLQEFKGLTRTFFPNKIDIKVIASKLPDLRKATSLQKLGDEFETARSAGT